MDKRSVPLVPGLAAAAVLAALCVGSARECPAAPAYRVLAANTLGMHCYDADFSVFSILPPHNEVQAQVLRVGTHPVLLGPARARMLYRAQRDPLGSINTTSAGKTNFWEFLPQLFGVTRPVDVGLLGARMPGAANRPRPFSRFDSARKSFVAAGIPITQVDNQLARNPYALLRMVARTPQGLTLATLQTVVPASDEMDCGNCHHTGGVAALDPGVGWSVDPDPGRQYRKNILLLHDARNGTALYAAQPVLCGGCHYTAALDFTGTGPAPAQAGQPFLSRAVHRSHAALIPQDPGGMGTCFNCHPGRNTQCERGAMTRAGIACAGCHGTMVALGRNTRRPWIQEPKCQSCHTGDALASYRGQIVRRKAYTDSADIATPLVAANKRFAEQGRKLYRNSVGHGGIACTSCHGSPHAEWPSREPNDNIAAVSLQRHDGVLIECAVCHGAALPLTLGGPHGMHNVGGRGWVDGHHAFFDAAPASCQACHGRLGEGTVISKTKATRVYTLEDLGTIRLFRGTAVGCGHCHRNPYLA